MKRLILIALLLFCIAIPTLAEESWNFNNDLNGWSTQQNITNLSVSDGILKGRSDGPLPILVSPNIYIDTDEIDTLEIRLKTDQKISARVFWVGTFDKQFIPQKQVEFRTNKDFRTYHINLKSRNRLWDGSISKIIISPTSGQGYFEIDYIKLKKGTLITNLISGFNEFFGPSGRVIAGSTINNIPNSSFLGKPITFYIYVFLFISIFVLLIKRKDPGSKIVSILFVFWILLAINSEYNNINIIRSDWHLLGKTLEQKQALTTDPAFYAFLTFCKEKLPPKSKIKFLTAAGYFDSKGAYYLFPHLISDEPDYLLIYKKSPELDSTKYTLYSKYKEGEYILKCN
ncbi:MAG: hypothetical protein HQ564_00750 [Candidatus Saganbacteria bacterium]|nr:hypothetical protein [Candidatus Saganbacteria bacterium]